MDIQAGILSSRVLTVDDYLPLSGLSLDRAVSVLPEPLRNNFETAWRWFMAKSGTVGSRMLGKRIPGVSSDFPISAQRGIHVPSKSGFALSVTAVRGSIYSATDQPLIYLPNGTWILEYSLHRNNSGGETDTRWNEGLINCLKHGLPVGVFIQQRGSKYMRYLAYVEEYHPKRGVFTLHGPVTRDTAGCFAGDELAPGPSTSVEYMKGEGYEGASSLEELEEDNRRFATIRQAIRDGQGRFREQLMDAYDGMCACTGCGVAETLQAAHIIGYRGQRSNTVNNGLLLRADLHLLFDSSLISIDPDAYRVKISRHLTDSCYSAIDGRRLRVPKRSDLRPNQSYLAAHYNKFVQIEHGL